MTKRRRFSGELKAKVALTVVRHDVTCVLTISYAFADDAIPPPLGPPR